MSDLIEKISELEKKVDHVDDKFTNALDKLSESMEKVAVVIVKLDNQEKAQEAIHARQDELTEKLHNVDKQVAVAKQAADATAKNTQEIKATMNKLLWVFISGFFSLIVTGVVMALKS
jgi:DNA repair exonuclease SbcCD ATPase subunit